MKDFMTVSLLQTEVVDDLEQNLTNAFLEVKKASLQGADIVVLPEMFCCPYQNEAFVRYSESRGGRIWNELSRMARENHIWLIGGSMPEKDGEKIYNSSFVFSREGIELACHRKVHLFDIDVEGGQRFFESDTFSAGSNVTIVDTEFGKIGVVICFDIRFPELSRLMTLSGIRALFVPAAFNMTTGPAHWELHFRSRALDNQIFVFGCAPAFNKNSTYSSYGNSIAVDPWGKVLDRLDNKKGSLRLEIDLCETGRIRKQLPLLSARRTDIYDITMK